MKISPRVLLKIKNISNKISREIQNTHFMYNNFFPKNRAVYETISKNMVEPERPETIWRMRVACWINKATRAQAHTRTRAPTPTHAHTYSRARAHTHTHTHRNM